ncbi:hypothetical protein [Aquidulcibacter paucihalophilus]|uniref:hypothetical protein n=1 Tax=Aquidulcibacter paucihalophilus TaxID=1978549 RepID=UPI000A1913CA|nr:hypothetical protein [Aquidulcibacter paucihalophilus]
MIRRSLSLFVGVSAFLSLAPALAKAAPPASPTLDRLYEKVSCERAGQSFSGADLRQRLILQAGLPMTGALLQAIETRSLGQLAASSNEPALAALLTSTISILANPEGGEARFTLTGQTAPDTRARAIAFLNGETDGISLTCKAPSPPLPAPPAVIVPAKEPAAKRRGLILADSKNDFIKPPRERGFATLGFEEDKAADTRLLNASLALAMEPILFAKPSEATELRWTPFVQYNRRAARSGREEVNDLTLGNSFIFRNPKQAGGAIGFGSLAFQTDDAAKAAVWVGDALIDFPRVRPCTRRDALGWAMRCNLSIVVDYADVQDPGDSQKLAELDTYFRGGMNLGLSAEQNFGFGVITISSSYNGRYDISSRKASGGIFSVGAGLRPSAGSNISLETRYTRGTTINTLVDVDKITLRLGYRL